MDFWPTEDQRDLQAGVRSFLTGRFPLETVVGAEASDAVIDPAGWRDLAAMGIFSLLADGFDMRTAVLGFEELGRALVPGPLAATFAAASVVDGAATGDRVVGLFEPNADRAIVEHGGQVDDLLWFSSDRTQARLVDPAALDLVAVNHSLDPLSPASVTVRVQPDSTVIGSGDQAVVLWRRAVVAVAAQMVGVAAAATDLANAYAKEREQFGRPIGSFQAVKHLLAEMFTKTEVARAAVHAAACSLDGASDDEPDRAVSAAKVMAGDAAVFGGKTGIQVHGGMGFTWEVHAQRYWKRAVVLDATLGTGDYHAARIAATLTQTRPAPTAEAEPTSTEE